MYHCDGIGRFPPVRFLDTSGNRDFAEEGGERCDHPVVRPDPYDSQGPAPSAWELDDEVEVADTRHLAPREAGENESSSCSNVAEAQLCVAIAVSLVNDYPDGGAPGLTERSENAEDARPRIINITPYLLQKGCIEDLVETQAVIRGGNWEVSVLTAEKALGEQADVVIVSTVRSQFRKTSHGPVRHVLPTETRARTRFVSQRNRVAVMCTRARFSMIVIGDSELLASTESLEKHERDGNHQPPWDGFIQYCLEKKCYADAVPRLPG